VATIIVAVMAVVDGAEADPVIEGEDLEVGADQGRIEGDEMIQETEEETGLTPEAEVVVGHKFKIATTQNCRSPSKCKLIHLKL